MKVKLDLDEIYERGDEFQFAFARHHDRGGREEDRLVEIIPGKGPPGGEGLRQRRPRLRPLPWEVAGRACP